MFCQYTNQLRDVKTAFGCHGTFTAYTMQHACIGMCTHTCTHAHTLNTRNCSIRTIIINIMNLLTHHSKLKRNVALEVSQSPGIIAVRYPDV